MNSSNILINQINEQYDEAFNESNSQLKNIVLVNFFYLKLFQFKKKKNLLAY
jgi:hypothetical protein